MRCVDQAGLRERIEELLSEQVGLQRLSTVDQAEALIAVAVGLLNCRGGRAGRDQAALWAHELVDRCGDRPGCDVVPAKTGCDVASAKPR